MVNKVDWFVRASRYPASISLDFGEFNGYIIVSRNNPYFGRDYDDVDIPVHGGFTFSMCAEELDWIEIPSECRNSGYWVLGWDTKHYGDTRGKWPKEKVEKETARAAMDMQIAEIRQEMEKNRKKSGNF